LIPIIYTIQIKISNNVFNYYFSCHNWYLHQNIKISYIILVNFKSVLCTFLEKKMLVIYIILVNNNSIWNNSVRAHHYRVASFEDIPHGLEGQKITIYLRYVALLAKTRINNEYLTTCKWKNQAQLIDNNEYYPIFTPCKWSGINTPISRTATTEVNVNK